MRLLFALSLWFFSWGATASEITQQLPAQLPEEGLELLAMAETNAAVFEFPNLPEEKAEDAQEIQNTAEGEEQWLASMRSALIAKGAGEQIALDAVRYGRNVQEARQNAAQWNVQDIVIDTRTSRFSGKLVAEGKPAIPFRGRYGSMQLVPVLSEAMQRGQTVRESNYVMKPVLAHRVRGGSTITAPEQLVGRTLKRNIQPGQPLRLHDLDSPAVVKASGEVEMVYNNGGIMLIDRGFAMEEGALGEVIRVKNAKSGSVVRARIDSATRVSVSYLSQPEKSGAQAANTRSKGARHAFN